MSWKKIGIGDYKKEVKGGLLRVERLDKNVWWYAIYIGDREWMSGVNFPHLESKQTAKYMAESIYQLVK
jgi:hypothetical protein